MKDSVLRVWLLVGALWHLLRCGVWGVWLWLRRRPRRQMTELWGERGSATLKKLGVQFHVTKNGLDQIQTDQPIVVAVYHPFSEFLYAFGKALHSIFPVRRVMPTAKREHIWNPLGWGILAAGGALIPRGRDGRGVEALKNAAKRALAEATGHGPVFVIFWDGHRPRDGRIREAQDYLRSIGEVNAAEHLQHVQIPRLGGVQALIQALPHAALVECTMGFSRRPGDGKSYTISELREGTLRLHFERVEHPSFECEEKEVLRAWLRDRALTASDRIGAWQDN